MTGTKITLANLSDFNIWTHNGAITVVSTATGQHRTFAIRTWKPKKDEGEKAEVKRVLCLYVGGDNEDRKNYIGFAFVDANSQQIRLWSKFKESKLHDSFRKLFQFPRHYIENNLAEYYFEGRCRVCNRTLTNPESIKSGIGPECASRQ